MFFSGVWDLPQWVNSSKEHCWAGNIIEVLSMVGRARRQLRTAASFELTSPFWKRGSGFRAHDSGMPSPRPRAGVILHRRNAPAWKAWAFMSAHVVPGLFTSEHDVA